MNDHIPDWFYNHINDLFQHMYMIGLPNTPPSENLDKTFQVWVNILWGDQNKRVWQPMDLVRFTASFRYVMEKAERFPAPADILKNLPERNSPLLQSREQRLALPAPVKKLSEEERELERQKLRNAVVEFSEKMNMENHLKQKAREKQQRDRVLKSDFEGLLAATKRDLTRLEMTFESCPSPCPHTASPCIFYVELIRVISEMQAWEIPYSALTSPPIDAVPSDPEPVKKRRRTK